jgi:hypothetical protein
VTELNSNDQTSNQNLTGNRRVINKEEKGSKSTIQKNTEEPSTPIKDFYNRYTRGFFCSLLMSVFNYS